MLKATLAILCFASSIAAQGLVFLDGAAATSLDVKVVDENQLAAGTTTTLLQGIEVMPVEITGRRASQDLNSSVSRVTVINDVPRIELPGQGRIIAYRRQGGAFWGFLFVRLLGGATVLVERPGTGANQLGNPFADRIAVSSDGVHAIIPRLGGATLDIFRLDGGTLGNGLTSRTVTINGGAANTGLMVGSTHAFATAGDHIYRFPLASGNAVDMTPTTPLSNPRLKPSMVMSGDGHKVAFLYGDSNITLQIYLLTDTASAPTLLPPPPSKYEEPGYLPEDTGDLRLMLNDDGSRLFYIETGIGGQGHGGDESYLLDTTGVLPTLQITSDAHFQPYIGIHMLPSFKATTLMAAIGDVNLMDWFTADLTATGGTLTNLSATGSVVQPFPAGTLVPSTVKVVGGTAFATDVTPTAQTLRTMNLTTGASQVLAQDLPGAPAVGSALIGQPDLYVPGAADRIYSGLTGNLIGAAPAGMRVTPPVTTPFFGVTSVEALPTWSLVVAYTAGGDVIQGPVILNLKQLALTPNIGLLVNSPTELLYFALGRPMVASPIPNRGVRVFLTGAGN